MDGEPLVVGDEYIEAPDSQESVERWFRAFLRDTGSSEGETPPTLRAWVGLAEAWRIVQALQAARGNRSAAARSLGIGRRTLYAKMERLGIEPASNLWVRIRA
jgi:DNA-binding NtrC family response regulator